MGLCDEHGDRHQREKHGVLNSKERNLGESGTTVGS